MIDVDDWAEIRRLHFAERLGIKTIARQLGIARNTVRAAVRSGSPPNYERPRRPSLVDAVESEICGLLKSCPTMPGSR
jgi:transposase